MHIPLTTAYVDSAKTPSLWLIELEQISAEQQPLVGTKALHLARMTQAGFAVPEGFCITTAAYKQGVETTSPPSNNRQPSLSPPLRTAILAAFARLQQRYPTSRFAVRSSALEEDGQQASWAGMFLSSLSIESGPALLRAVAQGFGSLYSDPVCHYRQQLQLAANQTDKPTLESEPAMALIIQRQIEPNISGMLFTRNPLAYPGHPDYERLCINAVRGLGEPLADGQVDGDHYWLDRNNRLLEHRLAPAGQSVQPPVLSRVQMRNLAQAARALEQQFGYPLDIEFALHGQQLWLLQARAIVSNNNGLSHPAQHWLGQEQRRLTQRLEQLQRQQLLHCGPGILSNSNIAELLPSPTPMSFAVFKQIFAGPDGAIPNGRRALGYRTDSTSSAQLFELVAGQPYFHLEIDARTYEHAQPLPINTYLQQIRNAPQRANYPEFGLYQQFSRATGSQHCRANRRFHRHMCLHAHNYLKRYQQWIDRYLDQQLQQQREIDLSTMNAPQLIIQINRWLNHLRKISCCHFVMAARLGFYFAESLRFQLQQLLGPAAEPWMSRLLQALPGSRINQQSIDLQAVREQHLPVQTYIERYGHLASNELELALPRYDENPELIATLLDTLIHTSLASGDSALSQQAFKNKQRQRKRHERQFSQQLDALQLPKNQRQQLWSDLRLARRFLPLRETIKYHYAGEYALIRKALLQLAQRLPLHAEQIFYLQPDELPLCLKELPQLRKLIEQRQQQHQLAQEIARQQPLPAVLFGDRLDLTSRGSRTPTIQDPYPRSPADSQHSGQPMAPGFIYGKVRLIDAQQCDLHQLLASVDNNDIIVTRSANLGLAPLLRKVAGLIVEVGGLLAHSACQAREAGIPAMVLPDATRLLTEGSMITFDGKTGRLYCV